MGFKVRMEPTIDGSSGCRLLDGDQGGGFIVEVDLDYVLRQVRKDGGAEKRWDINRVEGEIAEGSLMQLLEDDGATVEVKRDFASARTGNIAVEGKCNDKDSGICATMAKWWAYVLDGAGYDGEVIVLIKTSRLRRLISRLKPISGGDRNASRMKLLPVMGLLRKLEGKSDE